MDEGTHNFLKIDFVLTYQSKCILYIFFIVVPYVFNYINVVCNVFVSTYFLFGQVIFYLSNVIKTMCLA